MGTDLSAEGRWLTYGELAQLRRIDKPSALKLALRRGWPRQENNTGQMRVLVPADWLDQAQAKRDRYIDKSTPMSVDLSSITKGFDAALQAMNQAHQSETAVLRAQIVAAEARLATTEARADRSDQALAAERSRADALRDRLATAEANEAEARRKIEEFERERRSRRLLSRLAAAFRGD